MDFGSAAINLEAVLIALYVRERTGKGTRVQTSQFQSSSLFGITRLAEYWATGTSPRPMGSQRPNIYPDQAFETSDGYLAVSVPHDGFWPKFCAGMSREDLTDHALFATSSLRVEHRGQLQSILEPLFKSRSTAHWVSALRLADVPAAPYQEAATLCASLLSEPQVQSEGMLTMLETSAGPMWNASPQWRFDKTEARIWRTAPRKGEHQDEVLAEVQLSPTGAA